MTHADVLAPLRKPPFTAGFTPPQMDKFATPAKRVRFEPGRIVFSEDEDCSEFCLIVTGRVGREIAAPAQPVHIETLSAGAPFGWSAILMGQGKYFQARTLEAVEALAFEGGDLRAMSEADPAFGYALMQHLLTLVAARLQHTRLQVVDMNWTPAKRAGA